MSFSKVYLLSAKVNGIKNIQKCIELDFYKKTIDKTFDPEKYRVKGLFGENGSGKTAIISAFSNLRSLIVNAKYLSDAKVQSYLNETINKATKRLSIECEFLIKKGERSFVVYNYSIGLLFNESSYQISNEKLARRNGNYPGSEYEVVYEVVNGELQTYRYEDEYPFIKKSTLNVLSDASLVSLLLRMNNSEEQDFILAVYPVIVFAASLHTSLSTEDKHELYLFRKGLLSIGDGTKTTPEFQSIVRDIDSLTNMNESKIAKDRYSDFVQRVMRLTRFIKLFKPDLKSIDIDRKEDVDFYSCELIMNYGEYSIHREFESAGIRKLISLFDSLDVAASGRIVFVDEIDSNINSIYLTKIIEFMMLYGKGQLCFTSHNIDVMNVLKDNKMSIDFLNSNQEIIRWINNGNKSPVTSYKNGLIEGMPYNVYPTDFIGILGE